MLLKNEGFIYIEPQQYIEWAKLTYRQKKKMRARVQGESPYIFALFVICIGDLA